MEETKIKTMFCSKCGKRISEDSAFCEFCGAQIQNNGNQQSTTINQNSNKKKMSTKQIIILVIMIFCIIELLGVIGKIGIISKDNVKSNITQISDKSNIASISDFSYNTNNGVLTLERVNSRSDWIIISDTYNVDGKSYKVTNFDNAIFNGCDAKIIYIPKTVKYVYDNTLAYLNADHIDIYYEGTEKEWKKIFKKYKSSSVSEEWNKGNAEEAGRALADKLNKKMGFSYNKNKFTYHYNSNINDIPSK